MIDFPSSPTVGQTVNSPNGTQWKWDGTAWQIMRSVGVVPPTPPDTRGYTFYQDAAPATARVGDTLYQPTWKSTTVWNGSAWVADPPTFPDIGMRLQKTTGSAYPGHNVGIVFQAQTYNRGNMYWGGENVSVYTPGVYVVSYEVQWGGSTVPNVLASWIMAYPATRREASSQVWPHTTSVSGLITSGSSVFRCAASDFFQIQVYTPSSAPAGIISAYMTIMFVSY